MKWKLHNDPLQYWKRSNSKTRNLLMKLLCIINEVRFCIKKLLCKQKYGVRTRLMNFVVQNFANLDHASGFIVL